MSTSTQEHRDHGFAIGLVMGTAVGAGLMMWFAPRAASELRRRVTDAAIDLKTRASEQCEQMSARAAEVADELTRKGQGVRDDVAGAVVRGAQEVERFAAAAKTSKSHSA